MSTEQNKYSIIIYIQNFSHLISKLHASLPYLEIMNLEKFIRQRLEHFLLTLDLQREDLKAYP